MIYKQGYVELLKSGEYVHSGEKCPICGAPIVSPDYPEKYEDEHICLNANCDYFYNNFISYEELYNCKPV